MKKTPKTNWIKCPDMPQGTENLKPFIMTKLEAKKIDKIIEDNKQRLLTKEKLNDLMLKITNVVP